MFGRLSPRIASNRTLFQGTLASGTSFPGGPLTNQRFYRTDLKLDCVYDGTRWLTTNPMCATLVNSDAVLPFSVTSSVLRAPVDAYQSGMWIDRIVVDTFVNTTNDGTKFWSAQLNSQDAAAATTTIGSAATTASDTVNNWTAHPITVGAAVAASGKELVLILTKTSTPGTLFVVCSVIYRLIVT